MNEIFELVGNLPFPESVDSEIELSNIEQIDALKGAAAETDVPQSLIMS
jgi:hypothetical protein